ncbi:MAG: DUF2782 domain-containing protein [Rhodanobacter sp.]
MKTVVALACTSFLFASGVFAQAAPPVNVPPPPGINDPGVKAVAPPSPPATPPDDAPMSLAPKALPSMKSGDSSLGRGSDIPDVSVHQQGENSVQEYRRSGRVYMVVVTPKNGIAQTYMVDPQGRLVDEHGQRPTKPVMYKVLEWGKAKPAADDASDATPADNGH